MNFFKRLFCRHHFAHVRNLYGDQIVAWGYKRSVWRCDKCGKSEGRDALKETV